MAQTTPDNSHSLARACRLSRAAGWVAFTPWVVATARKRSQDVLAGGIAR